ITTERLTRHYAPGLAAPCALLLLLHCAAATEVRADPVVINFDAYAAGSAPDLRNQYGVFFSTAHTRNGQIVNLTDAVIANSAAANTAPAALFGAQLNPLALRYNNVSVEFMLPIPGAPFLYSRAATDFVSFYVVGSPPGDTGQWTVAFFDDTYQPFSLTAGLIGTVSGTGDQFVSFSTDGPRISRFIFINSGPNLQQGIDTLSFNAPQTPEPATLVLFGSGVASLCLGRARRRRRAARSA
ncbi:MAG: PEP-CTERM sorting domain-containing protein, partial [Pyrinomonadaceae bacterium]